MRLRRISSITKFNPDNVVNNPEPLDRKSILQEDTDRIIEVKQFSDTGIFSERIFGSLDSKQDYACDCGEYSGEFYYDDRFTCPKCGTKVIPRAANIDKEGWIDLQGTYIIKYISYLNLEKIIGRENLAKIISLPDKITLEGNFDLEAIKAEKGMILTKEDGSEEYQEIPARKYWYIGIQEFKNKYTEILKYYHELNGGKEQAYFDFLEDPDNIFTDKIPIISVVLRPVMRTADGLQLDELDRQYGDILQNVKILQNKVDQIELITSATLWQLQANYFKLCELILNNIKAKQGLIRNQICGTRINFSARNIISPAKVGYKIDELVLPYLTMLELYKFEIINILSQIRKCNLITANNIWEAAKLKLNEEIYLIMKKMIAEGDMRVLLNRNPTISYGSILCLKIAGVKHDYHDMTMSLHNSILTLLAGDYDGDVLNVISIKDTETKMIFDEAFSPVNLLIDSNNGRFNSALNLERDQVLGLNNLLL